MDNSSPLFLSLRNLGGKARLLLMVLFFGLLSGSVFGQTGPINGTTAVCAGSATSLSDATTGGSWSTSAATIATVDPLSGTVTGIAAGTAIISYVVSADIVTTIVTVNPLADAGTVSGSSTVCVGSNITLTDGVSGGVWSSGAVGTASAGSTGIIGGVAAGTATISYGVTNSCNTAYATMTVTVNPLAAAGTVNGLSAVCVNSTITLTDGTSGGVWTSGAAGIAGAGSTGIISGVAAGTATISYGVTNSCNTAYATKIVTVNALPSAGTITGSAPVCVGATKALTDATTGGAWSSGSAGIGSVGTSGIVTGIAAGTAVITYSITNVSGCTNNATAIVTVNALPAVTAVSGSVFVCAGSTAPLSDATSGGTWSSGTTTVATVATTGIVTGVAGGTSVISYKITGGTGCTNSATNIATINATTTITLGTNASVGTGVLKGFQSFTVTGATTYNLAYSAAAHTAGFVDVSGGAVPAAGVPFLLTIPSGVAAAVYSGTFSVTSSFGCGSATAPMSITVVPTGTWRTITSFSPHYNEGGMLLLTDGTVLVKTSAGTGYGTTWDKLTPVNGSYQGGTWSTIATMAKDRLYFSEQVLPDGRVYVCGGEYGTGGKYGEVYNPKTNTWTATGTAALGNPFPNVISDANSELLYNGKVLQASVDESGVNLNYLWDPVANTYSATANCLRVDNEAVWVKLADSSVLFLDNYGTTSERYMPKTGTWINDGVAPVNLYDPYGSEAGAGYTLPDGRIFFIGSTPKTAYYTPSGTTSPGTWAAGPAIPLNLGAADAASAMMANGKILLALSPTPTSANHFPSPAYYFEFDYTANTFTEVTAPGGGDTTSNGCFISNMLDLPDGNVMFVNQGYDQYYEYVPVNAPLAAGKPAIASISRTNCDSFSIRGTLFNGITEGAAYGDDWQMSTNYPIVRLTNASNTYYATTYNWNRIGAVSTGALADTATFALPSGMPVGTYSVVVVVNGNPSAPFILNTSLVISPATAQVCAGSNITLTDAATTGVWSSSGTAIGSVGSTTGIVTGIAAGTTTISYSINQCFSTATVTVNAVPTATTSQTGVSCFGGSNGTATVTASGGLSPYTYVWSPTGGSASTATGLSASVYSCAITDAHTCSITQTVTITQPSQPLSATTAQTGVSCFGGNNGTASVTAGGGTPSYSYAWSPAGGTASSASGLSAISYTCTITDANSCTLAKTFTITQPAQPLSATTAQTGVSCFGGNNGTASVTAGGGTPSYSYAWSPAGGTASSASGLSAISYTCTITDANSCTLAKTFTITQPAQPLSATTAQTGVSCFGGNNGTASVTASGGTGGYAYVWSPAGGTASSASGLSAISYTCTITDANSCTLAKAFSITQPAVITLTLGSDPIVTFGTPTASITYTVTSGSPTAYTIAYDAAAHGAGFTDVTIPATLTSSPLTLAVPAASAGSYNGVLTVSNGTCSSSGNSFTINITGGGNIPPSFTGGSLQGSGICENSGAGDITSLLTVSDPDAGQTETWTIVTGPAHGTLSGFAATAGSGGSSIAPGGLTYAPGIGYSGTDAFTIQVSDGSATATTTINMTVNPIPAAISGTNTLCVGSGASLSDATGGGTWSSSAAGIVSVGSTGSVNGVGAGVATISYSTGCGTAATHSITAIAAPGSINGASSVCAGSSITLTDNIGGGTWSSSNPTVGSIDATTGIVSGSGAGTTTINYTTGCGADATLVVNVVAAPASISGTNTLCVGSGASLSDATGGGTWSSSAAGTVSVGSTGSVNGVGAGVATISYSTGCGTAASLPITVNAVSAGTINGLSTVNVGSSITLSDVIGGGTWNAGNSNATVSGGIVTGVAVGTVSISYTVSNSCGTATATKVININVSSVAPVTGTPNVCVGFTTALTDATAGGTWSSGTGLVATVATSGVVTGAAAGTATISYTVSGVSSTIVVTVNANPSGIGGASGVCIGSSVSVSDFTAGGTWTSTSGASAAGTGTATGLVTGVSAGTAIITYSLSTGCYRTLSINVNANPAPISGATVVCTGGTSFVSDATSGGVSWSSSNTGVATIGLSGGILGVAAGTVTITYLISSGCIATAIVTVGTPPATITGNTPVCQAATLTLGNAIGGGAWTSSNTAKATIDIATGVVTGTGGGTATITYTTGGAGCSVTAIVTVNPLPIGGAISGSSTVCTGSTVTLSDAAGSGAWSSGATGVATVTATGVVTGISAGTATISYTVTNGCGALSAVLVVTVSPAGTAGSITGTATACTGATTNLTDPTTGGSWSSSATSVATVDPTGLVTGITAGTATISYAVPGSCGAASATMIVTVTGVSAGTIMGASSVYTGSGITLSDLVSGGTWSASNANATVSGGLVTGVSAGTVVISYSVTNGCGAAVATAVVTVNLSAVASITGIANACVGLTTALTDATPGGTWHSSNTLIATVSTSGIVTGAAVGTVTISYTVSGIPATVVVTINTNPSGIGGASSVCVGSSVSVSDFTPGGTWSSTSNASVVSTGTASGLVTGVSAGTATITYSLGSSCFRTFLITVNANPVPISGTLTVCAGGRTFVSDATTSGVSWTSGTTSVATVSASGAVIGVAAGTTIITYTLGSGCRATAIVTVNPLPVVDAISGPSAVSHAGPPITLSDVTAAGVWSSTAPAVATVGSATGVVTAIASSGNTTISYTVNLLGCIGAATKVITASPSPHMHGGGAAIISAGTTVNLADDIAGGIWGSSNSTVATVDDNGLVMGVAAGFANITHTINDNNGESYTETTPVTVNSAASDIHVLPNPNNGTFTIKGKLSAMAGAEVNLKITDMLGQEIYRQVITTQDGFINEQIKLGSTLANGMYILNLKSGSENSLLHFVIEK